MTEYIENPDEVHRAEPIDHHNLWPFPVQDFGYTNYAVMGGVFDRRECADIIELHHGNFPARRDRTITSEPPQEHHYEVALLAPHFAWVYERLAEVVLDVNREHWRYGLTGMVEPMRTIHHVVGDQTALHCDHTEVDISKIAWSVCLLPAVTGGRFFLATFGDIELDQGDAVFFPSLMGPGVTKVKTGNRYQLAGWAAGPRFV
jgi:hypothetical protein